MNKICKTCLVEKELDKFVNQNGVYRNKCKECKNSLRRTGKPRSKFPKGHIPWNKDTKAVMKPWNIGINPGNRYNLNYRIWAKVVKDRDEWKCTKCGSKNKVHAHHIIPWKEDETKRFDITNGTTLCMSCHGKLEGFQKGHTICNGRIITDKHRENLRKSHLGKPNPNKGKKLLKKVK